MLETSDSRDDRKDPEDWREKSSPPRESRGLISVAELCDMDDAVDTHRDSSGQAPMASVGEVSGDTERWI